MCQFDFLPLFPPGCCSVPWLPCNQRPISFVYPDLQLFFGHPAPGPSSLPASAQPAFLPRVLLLETLAVATARLPGAGAGPLGREEPGLGCRRACCSLAPMEEDTAGNWGPVTSASCRHPQSADQSCRKAVTPARHQESPKVLGPRRKWQARRREAEHTLSPEQTC